MEMSKEQLIEKIAVAAGMNSDIDLDSKKNIALKVASQMLMAAADKQSEMMQKMAKLEDEILSLRLEKQADEKHSLVSDVVAMMFENGTITKQAMENKEKELLKLDTNSIIILKDTLNSIPSKVASEGLNELTFLYGDTNIREKESFATAVAEYGKTQ